MGAVGFRVSGSGMLIGMGILGRWGGARGPGVAFCNLGRGFSAGLGGAFILAGGWALGYHSMGFRHFTDIS